MDKKVKKDRSEGRDDLIAAVGFCGMVLLLFPPWGNWGAALVAFSIGFLWAGGKR